MSSEARNLTTQFRAGARRHVVPACVLLYFVVMAGLFAWQVPPFESPDETGHLFYTSFVARELALPDQDDPRRSVVGEGHQFPLYYLLAAVPVRMLLADDSVDLSPVPNRPAADSPLYGRTLPKFVHTDDDIFVAGSDRRVFYLLRGISILLGCGTLLIAWGIAAEFVLPAAWRALAMTLVATLPQFLFISASINNDNLGNLLVALVILLALRAGRVPAVRGWLLLGAALGLALATKKTALFLLPGLALPGLVLLWRAADRRRLAVRFALAALPALAISGWVFARNQALYGDPLGSAMERRTLPLLIDEKPLWSRYWLDPFLPRFFESFVGVFGWMDLPLPRVVHIGYLALAGVALFGLLRRSRVASPAERDRAAFALLLIGLCFAGIVVYNLNWTQYQGRFLFPVIAPVAVLVVIGLRDAWPRMRSRPTRYVLAGCLLLALVAADIAGLATLHDFYTPQSQYISVPEGSHRPAPHHHTALALAQRRDIQAHQVVHRQ